MAYWECECGHRNEVEDTFTDHEECEACGEMSYIEVRTY